MDNNPETKERSSPPSPFVPLEHFFIGSTPMSALPSNKKMTANGFLGIFTEEQQQQINWSVYLTLEPYNISSPSKIDPEIIEGINKKREKGLRGVLAIFDPITYVDFLKNEGKIIMSLPPVNDEGVIENPVWEISFLKKKQQPPNDKGEIEDSGCEIISVIEYELVDPPQDIWNSKWFGDNRPLSYKQKSDGKTYLIYLKNYPYKTSSTP
jgi:hypothetical protein